MNVADPDIYTIHDVTESCVKGLFTENHEEIDFQKQAFSTNYTYSERSDENLNHWIFGEYKTQKTTDLSENLKKTKNMRNAVPMKVVGANFLLRADEIKDIFHKMVGKQIIIIGDSLGRQIIEFLFEVFHRKANCSEWVMVDFWGVEYPGTDCHKSHPFNPRMTKCGNATELVFIPHGKPIHHGGCAFRMPWMVDTLDRISKYSRKDSSTVVIFTPGAHFAAMNPVYYRAFGNFGPTSKFGHF